MEKHHFNANKQMAICRVFALLCIVCGVLSIAYTVFSSYDSATRPWDTVSSIDVGDPRLLQAVQSKPEEWPLTVTQSILLPSADRSNRYTVDITPVRGTALIRLDVIGRSPEHTTAFGRWLTTAFAHDFSASLSRRNIPLKPFRSLIDQEPEPAIPLRLHPGTLLFSLLAPSLLLASGLLLFRVPRANASGV